MHRQFPVVASPIFHRLLLACALVVVAACGGKTDAAPKPTCATTHGDCDLNALCADTASGMTCTCREGFTGDGKTCSPTGPVLTSGDAHSCGLWPDGALRCWGSNESGQLGTGTVDSSNTPMTVGLPEWQSVATGARHTVAVKKDGSLWWWGWDYQTSILLTTRRIQRSPVQMGTDFDWKSVTSSEWQICGLKQSGSVSCRPSWGGFPAPPAADPTDPQHTPPDVSFRGLEVGPWISLALGRQHLCAVKGDGTLWCWGVESQPSGVYSKVLPGPVQVGSDKDWRAVAAGGTETCAIKGNGTLWCWQHSYLCFPCFGDGPQQVDGRTDWSAVSVSEEHVCATRTDGTLWCWGRNDLGQLGTGNTSDAKTPTQVSSETPWTVASAASWHTCATRPDQSVWCWGRNDGGPSDAEANVAQKTSPVKTNALASGQVAVTAGGSHSCALSSDGIASCWGLAMPSSLCADADTCTRLPHTIGSGQWKALAAGYLYTCGIDAADHLFCWGANDSGNLGSGANDPSATPSPVMADTTWASLSVREGSVCAIDSAGELWCWGENGMGQLGLGDVAMSTSPVKVAGAKLWSFVSVGITHSCGLQNDGTLWCWGDNSIGELGDGTQTSHLAPIQVGSDTDWAQVSAGEAHTCALKQDGSAWCWGNNASGQLGVGSFNDLHRVPTRVSGQGLWTTLSTGAQVTCGLQQTGTLWCWGSSDSGLFGSSSREQLTPLQLGNVADWSALALSTEHACGVRSGVVWCWGSNRYNQLGDFVAWGLSPVKITQ